MKKFRRILGMTLVLTMLLVLCACGDTDTATTANKRDLGQHWRRCSSDAEAGGHGPQRIILITQAEYKFAELVEELSEGADCD